MLRVSVYVILAVRACLQAGGASFSVGKLIEQCRRSYDVDLLTLLREHARMSPRWRYIHSPSRMKTALCCADVGAMTGANKQAQCFGCTLSSVLTQSATAGERDIRNIAAWPRSKIKIYIYILAFVCIMGAHLVDDICVMCVEGGLVLSTTVQQYVFLVFFSLLGELASKAGHCQLEWKLTQGYGR